MSIWEWIYQLFELSISENVTYDEEIENEMEISEFVSTPENQNFHTANATEDYAKVDYSMLYSMLIFPTLLLTIVLLKLLFSKYKGKNTIQNVFAERTSAEKKDILTNQTLLQIHYATKKSQENPKYIEICKDLLRRYPSAVNIPCTAFGYTPFLRACMIGRTELVKFMLEIGADINVCATHGENPIYLATYAIATGKTSNFDILKVLLSAGCPINIRKASGFTSLHVAARFGNRDLIRWLLINGSDPLPSGCVCTPHKYALKFGHLESAALLDVKLN